MSSGYSIRQATQSDFSLVSKAIRTAQYIHRHLDWSDALDWLGFQPFLLLERDREILAFLACPVDSTCVAWIRSFMVISGAISLSESWQSLFSEALILHKNKPPLAFVALGLQGWFCQLLMKNQFTLHQHIVILEWNGFLTVKPDLPSGYFIRVMNKEDLPAVQQIDQKAFDPIWQNSLNDLTIALKLSPYATVIEWQDSIIGYQICTSTSFGAHLARLAVIPERQRCHLGLAMVHDLQEHFKDQGNEILTVNTQDNNFGSLALYHKLGFFPTGETFPVYIYH